MSESKFIPTLQAGNGYTYLKLKGILDEDNLLVNLLSQIQGRLLLIDMAEIERINSCGVRDWVNWLNQIQALGIAVILLRCSPVVVSQTNMVTNFAADAFIHSFYAPYVHPDTGDEQSVLLFTEDIRQNLPVHAPKIFNEAGDELEFDEFEESYFAFISDPRIMNYQIPQDIQAVIQYFLPEAATRQPVISSPQSSSPAPVQPAQQPIASRPMMGPQSTYNSAVNAQSAVFGRGGSAGMQSNPYANMNAQANPYSGVQQTTPYSGMNKPLQSASFGQGVGAQSPVRMPQPAQPMRHEQPPIPSSSGYQQAPGAPRSTIHQPAQAQAPDIQQPAPMPIDSTPRPAPQPVSQLAKQSMARKIQESDSGVQNQTENASYNPNAFKLEHDKKLKKFMFIGAAAFIVLLIIVLIIILCSK